MNDTPAPHRLATWRAAHGLTQSALAERVGCKRWMINQIERRRREPSMALLRRLVAETGLSADDLLGMPGREAAE